MEPSYAEMFARNRIIVSSSEQRILRKSLFAIAGVGGIGGLLAERLVRMGVLRVRICDPGRFDASNTNRQYGACASHRGALKVDVLLNLLKEINPQCTVEIDRIGITDQQSASTFAEGSSVVIDAMDAGLFRESIYLQRAARAQGLHYLFGCAIGYGAAVSVFAPDGITLEEYNGIPPGDVLRVSRQPVINLRGTKGLLPSYLSSHAKAYEDVLAGKAPARTTSIGVGLAAILVAWEAVNVLIRRAPLVLAPRVVQVDLCDRFSRIMGSE